MGIKIGEYDFGRVVIDGHAYSSDLLVLRDRVRDNWWREDGHNLEPADLEEVLGERPEILVIGTGYFGAMKVPAETVEYVKSRGTEVFVLRTGEAVKLFNSFSGSRRTAAALHLTC